MNYIRQLLLASACVLILSGTAMATPVLVGTSTDIWFWTNNDQPHQDTLENVNSLVDIYNAFHFKDLPEELTLLGKYEIDDSPSGWEGDWEDGAAWGNGSPYFEVEIADNGKHGSWEETSDWSGALYFSVKTGTRFALYYVADSTQEDWDTNDLWYKEISHISFWTTSPTDPPDPVPEPATLVLLGIGILGLARTGRKHMR